MYKKIYMAITIIAKNLLANICKKKKDGEFLTLHDCVFSYKCLKNKISKTNKKINRNKKI